MQTGSYNQASFVLVVGKRIEKKNVKTTTLTQSRLNP